MAFTINKSIIQGSKKHSALLAKAEVTRTHGGDPTLGEAARLYGESNSPNVIDYSIKTREIEWDKKEEEEKDPKKKKTTPPIVDPVDLKNNAATYDANNAKRKVIENHKNELEKKLNEPPKTLSDEAKQKQLEINRFTKKEIKRLDELITDYGNDELPDTPPPDWGEYEETEGFFPEVETDDIPTVPPPPKPTPAHENPKYKVEEPKYDAEGNLISLGGITMDPGYKYDPVTGTWIYNGIQITPREVPKEEKEKWNQVKRQTEEKKTEKKTEKKKDSKPRPWQYKTVKSYNEAKAAWKAKQ